MSRYIKVGSTILITLLLALSIMKISGRGIFAQRAYNVLAFAEHTETGEKLVVYQAMYAPFKICARPYDMFMSEVDHQKYPGIRQHWRFEINE